MWRSLQGVLSPAKPRLFEILSELDAQRPLIEFAEGLDRARPALFDCLLRALRDEMAAKAVTLKLLNLVMAKHHFRARSTDLLSKPPGLVVDPSNACNLACPGCVHSEHAKELKLFDWKPGILAEKRMGAFYRAYGPAAIHIILCNYGEPLVHPDTPKFIRMAKTYLMHTMISTNLSLPRFDAEAYVESGLDYMVLSIDGATQAVYETFRKKGDMEIVIRNIRKLMEARRRSGKATPIVAWRYLAFEHNQHEIPAALEKARELGLDEFQATPAWDISWDDPAIRPANIEPVAVSFNENAYDALKANWNAFPGELDGDSIQREYAQSWAEKAARSNGFTAGAGPSCEWLYKSITMDAGGRILPCCCAPTPTKDLEFAQFENGAEFNSEKHRMSRLFFADADAYRAKSTLPKDTYCVTCEWDKVADPSDAQIRNYFQVATGGMIEPQSLDLLGW